MIRPNFDYDHVQKNIPAGVDEGWLEYIDGKHQMTKKGRKIAISLIRMHKDRMDKYSSMNPILQRAYLIYQLLCQLEVWSMESA